jgi:hypothetical protein
MIDYLKTLYLSITNQIFKAGYKTI